MRQRLVVASHNTGKIKEIRALLSDLSLEIVSAEEAGVYAEPPEDETTLLGNALKKAQFVARAINDWAVADDTGLFIEALNGEPGVRSARWLGEQSSDRDLVTYTLQRLDGLARGERGAWFETVVVLASPDGRYWPLTGRVEGTIVDAPLGLPRTHLPYDLLFIPHGHTRTLAEMSDVEKNSLSHRGQAFAQLRGRLTDLLRQE